MLRPAFAHDDARLRLVRANTAHDRLMDCTPEDRPIDAAFTDIAATIIARGLVCVPEGLGPEAYAQRLRALVLGGRPGTEIETADGRILLGSARRGDLFYREVACPEPGDPAAVTMRRLLAAGPYVLRPGVPQEPEAAMPPSAARASFGCPPPWPATARCGPSAATCGTSWRWRSTSADTGCARLTW